MEIYLLPLQNDIKYLYICHNRETTRVPKFEQLKKIKAMAKGEERKEIQIEISKSLKMKNVDLDIITATTGLTTEEIEKL